MKPTETTPLAGTVVLANGTIGTTKQLYVDAGVVQLDGMFYNVGSAATLDITATTNYHTPYHAAAIPNGTNAGDEAILLVYVDPRLPNNIGFVFGSYVDTATGLYPQSPSNHLVLQNTVLAAVRVGKGASHPVILAIEDKRSFIRPGPVDYRQLNIAIQKRTFEMILWLDSMQPTYPSPISVCCLLAIPKTSLSSLKVKGKHICFFNLIKA